MNEEPTPDDELAGMLRAFDHAHEISSADMERLAHRIDHGAAAILAHRELPLAWWEFAIAWSRPLLSFGATTALVAALLLIWAVSNRPAEPARTSDSQALLNTLVAPVEYHIIREPNE